MEQQYTKGFNNGYIIAKHNPKLMNSISVTLSPSNPYTEGMIDGKEELEFVQIKEQLNEVKALRNNSNNREVNFDRE